MAMIPRRPIIEPLSPACWHGDYLKIRNAEIHDLLQRLLFYLQSAHECSGIDTESARIVIESFLHPLSLPQVQQLRDFSQNLVKCCEDFLRRSTADRIELDEDRIELNEDRIELNEDRIESPAHEQYDSTASPHMAHDATEWDLPPTPNAVLVLDSEEPHAHISLDTTSTTSCIPEESASTTTAEGEPDGEPCTPETTPWAREECPATIRTPAVPNSAATTLGGATAVGSTPSPIICKGLQGGKRRNYHLRSPTPLAVTRQTRFAMNTPAGPATTMPVKKMSSTADKAVAHSTPRVASGRKTTSCERDAPDGLGIGSLSIIDFTNMSYMQIKSFSLPKNSAKTYKLIFESLKKDRKGKEEADVQWSSGAEWMRLVQAASNETRANAIAYALAAMAFSKWHKQQTMLKCSSGIPLKAAAQAVSSSILEGELGALSGESGREQRRKNLNTVLSRGRKWSRVVDEFGFGILFVWVWELAKADETCLERDISELSKSPDKVRVLRLLEKQMEPFLDAGKTDATAFRRDLEDAGLLTDEIRESADRELPEKVASFRKRLKLLSPGGNVILKDAKFVLPIGSIDRLSPREWFDDSLILACLHLSDKLPFVRIGFSVPMHEQVPPGKAMQRPFEKAAKTIKEWHNGTEPQLDLVSFFPLLQHNSHFSLLEINETDGSIYHYDTLSSGRDDDVMNACRQEFGRFTYIRVQDVPQQVDNHSCGPWVVELARLRMLGRPVSQGNGTDATTLRSNALNTLWQAMAAGAILKHEIKCRVRRRADGDERPTKRRRGV